MYSQGWGVARDQAQATLWYRKAADQGDARAQYNVGEIYHNGLGGVARDDAEAVVWFRKAAAQGYAMAQAALRRMETEGQGGRK